MLTIIIIICKSQPKQINSHPPQFISGSVPGSLHKRYKTHPTQNNLNLLKSAESHLQQKISNSKTDYEQTLVNSCSNNMSKLFQYFNSITFSKSTQLTIHYGLNICLF